MRRVPTITGLLVLAALCAPVLATTAGEKDIATGTRLADLLRSGRSVVSNHQGLINDPAVGAKNLTGQKLVDEAVALYEKRVGKPPIDDAMSADERRLVEAQIAAMREVIDDNQQLIDTKGLGFKGFIPALFGRLVNERFEEKVGDLAHMKVTAPVDLVRNRTARPDAWEKEVIETRFLKPDWPKGKPYTEEVRNDGRAEFRMLIPEYYSASCLSCHGKPKGELDITGYPKEGGSEGDLSGAISITLFK